MMRRWLERGLIGFSWGCGALLFCALVGLVGFLFYRGGATLGLKLIFADTAPLDALLLRRQVFDGLFPAIVGTLLLIVIAISVALPVGIAAGIYMAEYAGGRVKLLLSVLFDVLAGLPSVVVGLSGFTLTIFLHQKFGARIAPCLLVAGLSLGFLLLPYLIRSTQMALESLPALLRQTAPALGASKLQNIFWVLLPASVKAISGGVILAIGRAAEDTAVIMLTGVVALAGVPRSLFDQFEALPFYIYYIASQYTDQQELATGFGAAIILLLLCSSLFVLAYVIQRQIADRLFFR